MGTDRLIYIRTDANSKIASGHLMRCFSIAQECQKLGMAVCFLLSDAESLASLENILKSNHTPYCLPENHLSSCSAHFAENEGHSDFSVLVLKTASYSNLELELPEVCRILSSEPCSASDSTAIHSQKHDTHVTSTARKPIFLLDSYYVTEKYLLSLRPLAKTAYLDDLQLFDYPVDLLINYDVIPDQLMGSYRAAYQNAGRLLLGARYAPLRRQFQNRKLIVRDQVQNILIATGGSDPCHFCLNFIEKIRNTDLMNLLDTDKITFHIIVGNLNSDREILRRLADELPFLQLHENVSNMAALMEQCDLAISAAGTTLYELCAIGLPAISFTLADNQLTAAEAFHKTGAIFYAGDIRTGFSGVFQNLTRLISEYSCARRKALHKSMHSLIDGKGAPRIAKHLNQLQK